MLKINHRHKEFHLPQFALPRAMQLSPVVDDGDELTQAIASDPMTHDDMWVLSERPDEAELAREERIWNQMLDDVRNDPEWFKDDETA